MRVTVANEATVRVSVNTDPDCAFQRICEQNPSLRIEQTSDGEIVLMAPTGLESSYRNIKIARQLDEWAEADGRGIATESNTVFRLPDGSKLGPDAAWLSHAKLSRFSPAEIAGFPAVVPEFIIELRSKSDRLRTLQQKMQTWIANGVELAWLIDADQPRVWIYRQGAEPQELIAPAEVAGDGPVAGFHLLMERIYQGPLR